MSKYILALTLSVLSCFSFAGNWVTNRDHSEVMFQVPYMGVSELTGRFNEFSGTVLLNDKTQKAEKLEVVISSSSIDTGNKMRDGHLESNDFFQSNQHPYIKFVGQDIKEIKPGSFRVNGVLTIKGISKPSAVDFTTTNSLKDTWGYENKFVKFKASLNRKDFNINWNKTLDGKQFLVGDVINFWGTFQIQPEAGKTPNSKHMIPDTEYIRKRDESYFSRKLRGLINGKESDDK